mmetsp:Transcript_115247/g.200606  ORF Transcript_115247/g.200606 Transcript_115247/m.200606 type:complete len:574 (-) Transcript_115247:340-2061(-)
MASNSLAAQSTWQNDNVMQTRGSLKLDSLEQAKVTSIFLQNPELARIDQVECVLSEMGCVLAREDVEAFCKDVGFEGRSAMSLSQFLALMQRVKYKEQELPDELSDISNIFAALENREGKASVQKIKEVLSGYGLAQEAFIMPKGTPKELNLEQFASMTGLDGRGMEGMWLPSLDTSTKSTDDKQPQEEGNAKSTDALVLSIKTMKMIKGSTALHPVKVTAPTDPNHSSSGLPSQEPNNQTQAAQASAEASAACLKGQKKGPRRLRLTRQNANKRLNRIFYDLEHFLHTVRCPVTDSLNVDPWLLTEPIGPALQEELQKEVSLDGLARRPSGHSSGANAEPMSPPMSPFSDISQDEPLPVQERIPEAVPALDEVASSKPKPGRARARPFSAIPSIQWRGAGSVASRRPQTATAARPRTAPALGQNPDRAAAALHRTALGAPGKDRAPPQAFAKRRSPSAGPARPMSAASRRQSRPNSSLTMSGLFDREGNYTFGGLSLTGYSTPNLEDRNRTQGLAPMSEVMVTASPCAARVSRDWAVDGGADPELPIYNWSCALPTGTHIQALGQRPLPLYS